MSKKLKQVLAAIGLVIALLISWNYYTAWRPVTQAMRNFKTVSAGAYHQYLVNPSVLVYDLRDITGKATQFEVLLAFLMSAEAFKDKSFTKVILAYRGSPRYQVSGEYFKKLGEEYEWQNINYTQSTFAENVQTLDGKQAFPVRSTNFWEASAEKLQNLGKLNEHWYINDLSKKW